MILQSKLYTRKQRRGGALAPIIIGFWGVITAICGALDSYSPLKEAVVEIMTAVDSLLLATVLLVIGYGLYELFVGSKVQLPPWLVIKDLDDLKN